MKSENAKSINASFWYVFSTFLTKGIGIIITPIITRLLTVEDFGIYNTYRATLTLLLTLTTLNILSSVSIARFDFSEQKYDEYISSITFLSSLSTTIIYFFALIFKNQMQDILGLPFNLITFMYFNILFSNAFSILQYKHRSQLRYREFVFLSILVGILSPILSIIIIMFQETDKYIGYIVGTQLPLMIIGVWIFVRIFKLGKTFYDKVYWKYSLHISIPMIPHVVASLLLNQIDRVFINSISGAKAVGIYSLAYSYATILGTLWTSLNQAWSPWFFGKLKEKNYQEIKSAVKIYTHIFSMLFLGMAAIGPEALVIFGTSEYKTGVWVILPILLGLYFQFAYSLYVNIEIYFKKTKYISLGTSIAAMFNILANFILIPLFGFIGAGYTTLLGYLLLLVFHYMFSKKTIKEDIIGDKFIFKWTILMICLSSLLNIFVEFILLRYLIYLIFVIFLVTINKKNIRGLWQIAKIKITKKISNIQKK